MFCVLFLSKWCAALSSAVSLGGPEGQSFRFNAKLVFENISAPYVNDTERFCKNEYFQQVPEYLKLRIHAPNDAKCDEHFFKQLGF